ncbi:MAG: methyltransferase domain-containing protein, partial [Candidatus Poribacteria bacterium]
LFLDEEIKAWPNSEDIEIIIGNLLELDPKKIGHFDLVMACEVIEHVAHGDELIEHLRKFLNPAGKLLITTPNGAYFRSKLSTYSEVSNFSELEKRQFKPDADGHLYLYTPEEITELLKKTGFHDIQVDLSITPWLSGHMGMRLLPSSRSLTSFYFKLDKLSMKLGFSVQRKLCTQMIIVASQTKGCR